MKVIVAEKPSVARDLAKVLGARTRRDGYLEGAGYQITWCFGHMVQLAEPARYNEAWKRWRAETLPMLPEEFKLLGIDSSRAQLKVLKQLLHAKATEVVVNACDAGREGELIFRYVYDLLDCDKPTERLWLASMTDVAIRRGFERLEPGSRYDALADAARCRSEADWLVGLNATRAMTLRCREQGAGQELMSIGRVQTPTLALIVQREQEIEAFEPETFWQVYATFDAGEQERGIEPHYEGLWTGKKKIDRFTTKESAEEVIKQVLGLGRGEVLSTEHKEVKERPPQLFDLTSLQRECNRRFGYSAQQTLDLAQGLYERHKLITYPRTDSNYLTEDMREGLPGVLRALKEEARYESWCQELLGALPLKVTRRVIQDAEVGDHHAIIPTEKCPALDRLSEQERRVYDLITRRFIAAFYPDALFALTRIMTGVGTHRFETRGKVRKEAGWQRVLPPPSKRQQEQQQRSQGSGAKKKPQQSEPILPNVSRGDQVGLLKARVHEGATKAPRRYSESALLGAMERAGQGLKDAQLRRAMKESGLGTPATRASIIETLLKREYVARQGKQLVAQPRGRLLIEALPAEELKSAELTGRWEAKLTQVARGEMAREAFMAQARALTGQLTESLLCGELTLPEGAHRGGAQRARGRGARALPGVPGGGARGGSRLIAATGAGRAAS